MLEFVQKPKLGIYSGKFGKSGKMIIKPYSIPDEYKKIQLKIFLRFVKISICGCWNWEGRIHNGYGVCQTSSKFDGSSRWAHRVSYALFNGPINKQMHIDHICQNRKCVNPAHLRQVTPIENYLAISRRKLRKEKKLKEENGQLTLW